MGYLKGAPVRRQKASGVQKPRSVFLVQLSWGPGRALLSPSSGQRGRARGATTAGKAGRGATILGPDAPGPLSRAAAPGTAAALGLLRSRAAEALCPLARRREAAAGCGQVPEGAGAVHRVLARRVPPPPPPAGTGISAALLAATSGGLVGAALRSLFRSPESLCPARESFARGASPVPAPGASEPLGQPCPAPLRWTASSAEIRPGQRRPVQVPAMPCRNARERAAAAPPLSRAR